MATQQRLISSGTSVDCGWKSDGENALFKLWLYCEGVRLSWVRALLCKFTGWITAAVNSESYPIKSFPSKTRNPQLSFCFDTQGASVRNGNGTVLADIFDLCPLHQVCRSSQVGWKGLNSTRECSAVYCRRSLGGYGEITMTQSCWVER